MGDTSIFTSISTCNLLWYVAWVEIDENNLFSHQGIFGRDFLNNQIVFDTKAQQIGIP